MTKRNNQPIRYGILSVLLGLALCVGQPAKAQQLPFTLEMPLDGVMSYDPAIPKPEDIIGHVVGSSHTTPDQVEAYFRAVASASDRVSVEVHAVSYEKRNLIHAVVTSPGNHARLQQIREANLRLSDNASNVTDDEISAMPAVVYQGYSIHGNEASGTEAAILYLYHLAAARGPAVEAVLDRVVVLLDPMFNPDGRDRFTNWANRNRGKIPVSDTQDREHSEEWPGGRTNHYWFDLNRDWLASQHPESQGRLALYHAWRPQVLTDHHEMDGGSTFFFQPGVPSRDNPNTPDRTYQLTAEIARFHADELDRIGSLYYSEESFDDFFLGKGSAYPDINGAVGILFEQASSRALETETNDGVLHYDFTIRNQFAASLSTLKAVATLREKLLRHQRDFYRESVSLAAAYSVKAYLISLERGRTRAQALAQILQRHRVSIYGLDNDVTVDGMTFTAGAAYVIPMNQPQFRLIKAVMERTTSFADSLFYDVSTWTLPLAHDVDYRPYVRNPSSIVGQQLGPVELNGGEIVGGLAEYAYLMRWDRYYAPRSLYRLLKAGVPVRLTNQPFTAIVGGEPVAFDRGTMVIPLRGRDVLPGGLLSSGVRAIVESAVQKDHTLFYATSTGLTPTGPDLGGESTELLEKPTIALLVGGSVSSSVAGEVWHLLSERFEIPVSLIDSERLDRFDLSRYDVIVHPGGNIGSGPAEALKAWTRRGGRLILFSGAIEWARAENLLEIESIPADTDSLRQQLPFDQIRIARDAESVPGSIFALTIDTTHPLGYGLPAVLPVLHMGTQFYAKPETAGAGFGRYTEDPLLSGYISDRQYERLKGSTGAIGVRAGSGHVVVFMDRLSFRAYWYGSQRLLMNAIFLSDSY